MLTGTKREATAAEILEKNALNIRQGWKVSFRHFTMELCNPRARNGVSHRQHSRSKLYIVHGKPHVCHHGKLEEVTATRYDAPTFWTIYDLRLKSEYLN